MTRPTILKFGAVEHADGGDLPGWIIVEGHPTMQTAVQHTTEDGNRHLARLAGHLPRHLHRL